MTDAERMNAERRASLLARACADNPGWATLITDAVAEMVALDPDLELPFAPGQKFGILRFPTVVSTDPAVREALRRIEQAAVERSMVTCQRCGNPGSRYVSTGLWYTTLCPDCATALEDEGRVFRPATTEYIRQLDAEWKARRDGGAV